MSLRDVYQHRALLKNLVARDLKGRYVGSAMGFFWNIINPLVLLSVYTFVFSYIMKAQLPPGSGTDSFTLYLFCGFLPWIAFSEALNRTVTVIIDNASLVSKVKFPAEVLVVYIVVSSFIHELLALALLIIFLIVSGAMPGEKTLFLPVLFAGQLLFTLGLSFIFSSMNVYVRDVAQILGAVLMVWFFATPIMYPLTMVPEAAHRFMSFNPMTQLVETYRAVLLGNRFHSLAGMLYFFALSIAIFAGGTLFFSRTKKEFPDLI